jgi:hypothetical protein
MSHTRWPATNGHMLHALGSGASRVMDRCEQIDMRASMQCFGSATTTFPPADDTHRLPSHHLFKPTGSMAERRNPMMAALLLASTVTSALKGMRSYREPATLHLQHVHAPPAHTRMQSTVPLARADASTHHSVDASALLLLAEYLYGSRAWLNGSVAVGCRRLASVDDIFPTNFASLGDIRKFCDDVCARVGPWV